MYFSRAILLLTFFVTCLVEIYMTGTFYEKEIVDVALQSIIKRMKGVSPATCLLKCRKNSDCDLAAMDGTDCLFLRKGIEEVVSVVLLDEIEIKYAKGNKHIKIKIHLLR